MKFNLEEAPSQSGKIAIVTGANIGLGFETTIGLAKKGAKVIMACRNLDKAQEARKNIIKVIPNADLEVMSLDLTSLQSVREFAALFIQKHSRLDLLIANAGIMIPPFSKTKEGFESQFGVNYLAHFLLTNLLFPIIKNTPSSRIVLLSSIAHRKGEINFDNLNAEKGYSKMAAYSQSKLACLMFAYELQRRLEKSDGSTIAVAAHPGVSHTNLMQHIPKFLMAIGSPLFSFFMHSPEKGSLPTLMASIGTEVKGGDYYGPTGFKEMTGLPGLVKSEPQSHDIEVAKKLWEVSEKLTGEKFTV